MLNRRHLESKRAKLFKTRRQWISSLGHEVEDKDVQNKRCCIRTEDDRGPSLPQGSKVEEKEERRDVLH